MKKKTGKIKKTGIPSYHKLVDYKVVGTFEFKIEFRVKLKQEDYMKMTIRQYEELRNKLNIDGQYMSKDMANLLIRELRSALPEEVIVEQI